MAGGAGVILTGVSDGGPLVVTLCAWFWMLSLWLCVNILPAIGCVNIVSVIGCQRYLFAWVSTLPL